MKETEYFVSLQTSVVLTDDYNVMINSEGLIGTAEYLMLLAGCRITRCRYNRVRPTCMYFLWYGTHISLMLLSINILHLLTLFGAMCHH